MDTAARAPTTLAAFGIGMLVTMPFFVTAVRLLSYSTSGREVDLSTKQGLVSVGMPTNAAGNALLLMGSIFLIVSSLCLVLLAGVAVRRRWGRDGAIGLFSLLTLFVLPIGVIGMLSDPPTANGGIAVATGIGTAAVVALLLRPAVADEFERIERARLHARYERQHARREARRLEKAARQ